MALEEPRRLRRAQESRRKASATPGKALEQLHSELRTRLLAWLRKRSSEPGMAGFWMQQVLRFLGRPEGLWGQR